ncbi:hypothetical protein LZ31DRAFT_277395 [Colletotrichum somersetense]|nr:hypothetical protein LZ31DRAFT_277395 [Colletotrichum somersetense]
MMGRHIIPLPYSSYMFIHFHSFHSTPLVFPAPNHLPPSNASPGSACPPLAAPVNWARPGVHSAKCAYTCPPTSSPRHRGLQ